MVSTSHKRSMMIQFKFCSEILLIIIIIERFDLISNETSRLKRISLDGQKLKDGDKAKKRRVRFLLDLMKS